MTDLAHGDSPSISVILPVWRRHLTLARTLRALKISVESASQKGIRSEIIVSAFQPNCQIQDIVNSLDFRLIEVAAPTWSVAIARNAGIDCSRGTVVVLLDADILVPRCFVELHARHHHEALVLLVGAVNNYQSRPSGPIPYERAKDAPIVTGVAEGDVRWKLKLSEVPIPWALCWSGNISFRRCDVQERFDADFEGWGAEDLDWSFRLIRKGLRAVFAQAIAGWHQCHERDREREAQCESRNMRRLFQKNPCIETEFVVTFGDIRGNQRLQMLNHRLQRDASSAELVVQADRRNSRVYFGMRKRPNTGAEEYNLLGLITPWTTGSFKQAKLASWISELPSIFRERIYTEAGRVANNVILC